MKCWEKIEHQFFLLLKAKHVNFVFCYHNWWCNPLVCLGIELVIIYNLPTIRCYLGVKVGRMLEPYILFCICLRQCLI